MKAFLLRHTFLPSIILAGLLTITMSVQSLATTYSIPLRAINGYKVLYCDMILCGCSLEDCMIDTGCTGVCLTYKDYVHFKERGLIGKHNYVADVRNITACGKGHINKKYKMESLQIGNVVLHNVNVTFATSPNSIAMRLIGMEVFRCFDNMQLDIKAQTLYLTK